MSEAKKVLLSELGTEVFIDKADNYAVVLPDTDHIMVLMGANLPKAACRFDHPNLLSKANRCFECKHYRANGSKFWTKHAGVDFYFLIPKENIYLVFEKGYSYVKIEINGLELSFNTSGGTHNSGKGWRDYVGPTVHTHIGCTLKSLKALAEVALSPDEVKELGFNFDVTKMRDWEHANFVELTAKYACLKSLKPDDTVVLGNGYNIGGKKEFKILQRPKRKKRFVLKAGYTQNYHATHKHIDWKKTAEANGIEVSKPTYINRVGEINEYVDPYAKTA